MQFGGLTYKLLRLARLAAGLTLRDVKNRAAIAANSVHLIETAARQRGPHKGSLQRLIETYINEGVIFGEARIGDMVFRMDGDEPVEVEVNLTLICNPIAGYSLRDWRNRGVVLGLVAFKPKPDQDGDTAA